MFSQRRLRILHAVGAAHFHVPEIYLSIFMLALLGYALDRLFLVIEGKLIRWHQESSGRI
jgi:ABC-type nitrate/sulfonate/bicarbonate transport system permease component